MFSHLLKNEKICLLCTLSATGFIVGGASGYGTYYCFHISKSCSGPFCGAILGIPAMAGAVAGPQFLYFACREAGYCCKADCCKANCCKANCCKANCCKADCCKADCWEVVCCEICEGVNQRQNRLDRGYIKRNHIIYSMV
jgi:hypothetical protein